ncbi:MAG: hypothetical protein RLZZ129_2213 [Verrucomicrobiota bacterium]
MSAGELQTNPPLLIQQHDFVAMTGLGVAQPGLQFARDALIGQIILHHAQKRPVQPVEARIAFAFLPPVCQLSRLQLGDGQQLLFGCLLHAACLMPVIDQRKHGDGDAAGRNERHGEDPDQSLPAFINHHARAIMFKCFLFDSKLRKPVRTG